MTDGKIRAPPADNRSKVSHHHRHIHGTRAPGETPDAVFELFHGCRFRGKERTPRCAGVRPEEREAQKIKRGVVGIHDAGLRGMPRQSQWTFDDRLGHLQCLLCVCLRACQDTPVVRIADALDVWQCIHGDVERVQIDIRQERGNGCSHAIDNLRYAVGVSVQYGG